MGYLKIPNLYKNPDLLDFDFVWASEKIHGTSAHISWHKENGLTFFSGGEKYETFVVLFDQNYLRSALESFQQDEIIVYGEAYGGKMQGMKDTYGSEPKFVAFDVKMNGNWLDVPIAETLVKYLKLEFVDYVRIKPTLENLNAERDKPSVQAVRNGCGEGKIREGIVIRPIKELVDERGNRIIAKHKHERFRETATERVINPEHAVVLKEANKIANEWVTEERLSHVVNSVQALLNNVQGIDKDNRELSMEDTKDIINIMWDDICREGKGEIIESPEAKTAVGKRTAKLYREWLEKRLVK